MCNTYLFTRGINPKQPFRDKEIIFEKEKEKREEINQTHFYSISTLQYFCLVHMASLPIPTLKTDNPKAVAFVQETKETVENIPSKGAAHLRRLTELANSNSSPFHLGSRSAMFPKRRENTGNNGLLSSG